MTKLLYYKTYFAKTVNQNDDVRTKNALEYIKKKKKKLFGCIRMQNWNSKLYVLWNLLSFSCFLLVTILFYLLFYFILFFN